MQNIPLNDYPRPQLKRDSFMCLNGEWDLVLMTPDKTPEKYKITVPFSPGCMASGVEKNPGKDQTMCYSRRVKFNEETDFSKERLLLHFGGVNFECNIFIDGILEYSHKGGETPFCLEVHKQSFLLDVMVTNKLDSDNLGQGGIWQTVWLEKVPSEYITNIALTPDLTGFDIVVLSNDGQCKPCTIRFGLKKYEIMTDMPYRIDIPNPQLWTPEFPNLYFFSIKMGEDRVISYTGLRTFAVKDQMLLLNGKPYFHHGVLDKGNYAEGLKTPIDDQQMIYDITLAKKFGFNTIRKYKKIENLRWYFHCDSLGMLVWQDIACVFEEDYYNTVSNLYNCVCVAMWTPVCNDEQNAKFLNKVYQNISQMDTNRTIDVPKGAFKNIQSVSKKYVYKPDSKKRCVILSECGGYNLKLGEPEEKKLFSRKLLTKGDLTEAITKMYQQQIIPAKQKGLAGSIYCQLADNQNDNCGFVSYDRSNIKVIIEDIASVSDELTES